MDPSPEVISKEEGLRLLKAGKIEDAIRVLVKVRETADDAQVCAYLGAAYSQKGSKVNAIRAFEESLRLDETPRAYYNLAAVYESSGRIDEAVREYGMAVDLDPNYAAAKEALDRLHNKFAAAHPEAQPEPAVAAAGVTQAMPAAPASQTQSFAGPPPAGPMIGQAPPPVADPFAHQQQNAAPTVQDLYARQMAKEQEIADQHHLMMKNGLIYGAICGSIFFVLANFASKLLAPMAIPLWATTGSGLVLYTGIVALIGAAYGCLVGLWIGYTCGGESAGMQAGAAIGAFLGLLFGLLFRSIGAVIVCALIFGILSGIVGMLIGRMVEASLPD